MSLLFSIPHADVIKFGNIYGSLLVQLFPEEMSPGSSALSTLLSQRAQMTGNRAGGNIDEEEEVEGEVEVLLDVSERDVVGSSQERAEYKEPEEDTGTIDVISFVEDDPSTAVEEQGEPYVISSPVLAPEEANPKENHEEGTERDEGLVEVSPPHTIQDKK